MNYSGMNLYFEIFFFRSIRNLRKIRFTSSDARHAQQFFPRVSFDLLKCLKLSSRGTVKI